MDLTLILEILAAIVGFYFLAFWVSLVVWTYRDISTRSKDPFVRTLAVALVAVLNLPGLFLYFVLRPKETLEEAYERSLEEEALLQDIEARDACPVCKQPIRQDYILCPNCHTQLKKTCPNCGRLLMLHWEVCPYCGAEAPAKRLRTASLLAEEPAPAPAAANPAKKSRS